MFLFSFNLDGGGKVCDVVVIAFVPLGETLQILDEGVEGRDVIRLYDAVYVLDVHSHHR